jgi:hypothetical protein
MTRRIKTAFKTESSGPPRLRSQIETASDSAG